MATTTDPVEALAATVNRLYDLSASSQVSAGQQAELAGQADNLADELGRLVEEQLDATAPEYHAVMVNLTNTTNALNQAEAKIDGLVSGVNAAADVAAAIGGLIQQVGALGTAAAKLAA
jgi:hypothetical protein